MGEQRNAILNRPNFSTGYEPAFHTIPTYFRYMTTGALDGNLQALLLGASGLVLFLFGVGELSTDLRQVAGNRIRGWLERWARGPWRSLAIGCAASVLLDSSSAVIILAIVLVNANSLQLRSAMGIVLGANLGTTFGSQIIALDVLSWSPVALLLGFLLASIPRTRGHSANILFHAGLLFFGLWVLELAVAPLHGHPRFLAALAHTESPLTGAGLGAAITALLQSSSATVGMVLVLAKQHLISPLGGIAVMLGAELGTCADTLLATVRTSRAALKTGLFHLAFNLITVTLALLLFHPFAALVAYATHALHLPDDPASTIALAHILFNLTGVLLFIGTLPAAERLLNSVVKSEV